MTKLVVKMSNGACIPQDELEKIFEPGTIAKANVSLAGNRGYGLTYARYVIEEHGGYLTADNIEDKTYFLAKFPII